MGVCWPGVTGVNTIPINRVLMLSVTDMIPRIRPGYDNIEELEHDTYHIGLTGVFDNNCKLCIKLYDTSKIMLFTTPNIKNSFYDQCKSPQKHK